MTPEFNNAAPEHQTAETPSEIEAPIRKTGFLGSLGSTFLPGMMIVIGIVFGAGGLGLASTAVIGGFAAMGLARMKKPPGMIPLGAASAMVAGSGMVAAASGNLVTLGITTLFSVAASAVIAVTLPEKKPSMSSIGIFSGALLGTALGGLIASASLNGAEPTQKNIPAFPPVTAAALAPDFKTVRDHKIAIANSLPAPLRESTGLHL